MDLSKIKCQEASPLSKKEFIACGRKGAAIIFHQHDGRNVYVMCASCADHNVKNRGGVQIYPGGDGFRDVLAFHEKFDLPIGDRPKLLDHALFGQRSTFMLSELMEFQDAHWSGDLVKAADSLLDLVYVAKGTAVCMGLPWEAIWAHVHNANMKKHREPGASGFKQMVTKPPGWVSPNNAIRDELFEAGALRFEEKVLP